MLSMLKKPAKAAALVAALVTTGVATAQQQIRIDGSSTVFPVTEAVAEEFQNNNRGVQVTVGVSGTGGGFKKFVRGETDISNASRPISEKEMVEAKANGIEYIELPVAFDAITVVVNPKNTWAKQLTIDELKTMWAPEAQGKIDNWKQVNSSWPDKPLKLYGPGADSGTFDYFTEAVTGKSKSSRGDFTASEDDNVLVQGVSGDENALGYFGLAYYTENQGKLKAVPIVNPQGKAVTPSEETVKNGTYVPLARPIFIYVNKKSLERPEVRRFVEFYLTNGGDLAKEVAYVALPSEAYQQGLARVRAGKTGTAFKGHNETGLAIDELFRRELVTEPSDK